MKSQGTLMTHLTPRVDLSSPFVSGDHQLRVLYIRPGAYDQPLVFHSGRWRLQLETSTAGQVAVGADLQWRGGAIYVSPGATLELVGLSIHVRLDQGAHERRSPLPEGFREGVGGVVCLGALTARRCALSTSGGHALSLFGPAQLTLEHSRLHYSGRCGLYVDAEGAALPAQLRCVETVFEWNGADQALHSSAPSKHAETQSEEHETDGVWLTGELNADFIGCHFQNNRGDGLYAKSGHVQLDACHFTRNEVNGAYAGERAVLSAQRCIWLHSGEAAVGVKGGRLELSEAQLSQGEGVGLFAIEGGALLVERCDVSQHRGGGVLLIEPRAGEVTLRGLSCLDAGQLGVTLERARGVRLEGLVLHGSSQAQLYAVESSFSCVDAQLKGGQFGLVAEDSTSKCVRVSVSEAVDVAVLLKPRALPDEEGGHQTQVPTAAYDFEALEVSQRGGVGLLCSGEGSLSLSGSRFEGDSARAPHELISLDGVTQASLTWCTLVGGEVGLRLRATALTLVGCRLLDALETALVMKEQSDVSARACQLVARLSGLEDQRSEAALQRPLQRVTNEGVPRSRAGAGLWCFNSRLELEDSRFTAHRGSQLVLLGASEAHCHHCVIERGLDAGVLIAQGARLTLTSSVVSGQKSAGVWLEREGRLEAQQLEVHHQSSGGIFVRDQSRATLIACRLHHHVKAAVMCDAGSVVSLDRCELSQGSDAGLLIERGAAGYVRRSRLHALLVGVAVHTEAHLELESSELSGGEVGVLCLAHSRGEVTGNWIYGQRRAALLVHSGSGVEVSDNIHISREELISDQH